MPSVDELERLSRYHSGELSSEDRAAVEAELAQRADLREGLEVLRSLDEAPKLLAPALEGQALDQLIAGVPRPAVEAPKRRWPALAIAAALLAGLVAYSATRARPSYALALGGGVTVDGTTLEPGKPRALEAGAKLKTQGGPAELVGPRGAIRLPAGAELAWSDPYAQLLEGTVVVSGDGAELRAGSAEIKIFGTTVASVEPENEVVRVNEALSTTTSEELVKKDWIKLPSLALAGGLTLFVIEGRAEAQTFNGTVTVRAGQKWQPGAQPTALAAAPKPPEGQLAPPPRLGDPGVTREQLVAEVEKLRDEKEALLKEREQLKAELAAARPKRNYYRLTRAEALEYANKNEIRIRGAMMDDEPFKVTDEAAKKFNLTDAERSKIVTIMADSSKRAHEGITRQYIAMGGDPNLASTLNVVSMLNEIRLKAVGDDYPDAIRQLAYERAGLLPPGDPNAGPVVLKTYRLLLDEDTRILDQLDALLGPSRAQALVNDDSFPHSSHGYSVGAKNEKK